MVTTTFVTLEETFWLDGDTEQDTPGNVEESQPRFTLPEKPTSMA